MLYDVLILDINKADDDNYTWPTSWPKAANPDDGLSVGEGVVTQVGLINYTKDLTLEVHKNYGPMFKKDFFFLSLY